MPRGWAATRARVLRRDPICRLCGAAPSTEAHHTQPGNEAEATIVGACSPCHRAVSLQQAAAARAAAR
jgi:5-methylcytosine-specific restriction enzyme A